MLEKQVRYVRGVGPKIGSIFQKSGIETMADLLYFFPRSYEDRRRITPFSQLRAGEDATTVGRVVHSKLGFLRGGRRVLDVVFSDGTGYLTGRWFQFRAGYEAVFKPGLEMVLIGQVRTFRGRREIIHPGIELISETAGAVPTSPLGTGSVPSLHFGRLVPVYTEIGGLSSRRIRTIMREALNSAASSVRSALPPALERTERLPALAPSLEKVHFPAGDDDLVKLLSRRSPCQRRIILEEFYLLGLGLLLRKRSLQKQRGHAFEIQGELAGRAKAGLGFALTAAQERCLGEVTADLRRPVPMHRLLEGDVGSGKTVVAFLAALNAAENEFQTVFMAPTEILAEQHHRTLQAWAGPLKLRVEILTGRMGPQERRRIASDLKSGLCKIVVGTHALIQDRVEFGRLGLVVVDEQHRFGVAQRAILMGKGTSPHVLSMTATPIPRTLAMTLYGDLDVSTLDELPPGRQPVATRVVRESQRARYYKFVHDEVKKGHQAFIVYPLIEESEKLYLKNAVRMAEEFQKRIFPDLRVGLVHGRMKEEDKDKIMRSFGEGRIDILVSTTVVEVGIDVPNATVMVVEHAERFGLSQLHQLRGRVGRGSAPSTCLLVAGGGGVGGDSARRLEIMTRTQNGFEIADEDLRIRGPGEFLGVRQSGIPEFHLGNLVTDVSLLRKARDWADKTLETDSDLSRPEHRETRRILLRKWQGRLELGAVG
ncbi:MAG: ATP-dependent DNA helicase RecG [Nitrospirae bacterium]|nr:ATP-dependent DNA helicase RecG [Nitrospirota bacterium]